MRFHSGRARKTSLRVMRKVPRLPPGTTTVSKTSRRVMSASRRPNRHSRRRPAMAPNVLGVNSLCGFCRLAALVVLHGVAGARRGGGLAVVVATAKYEQARDQDDQHRAGA